MVNFPKLKYDILFVYWTGKICNHLESLMNEEREVFILQEGGVEFSVFKTVDSGPKCENISALFEKSPIEVFPYIYDPNYSGKDAETKWSLFSILKKENGEAKKCGYFFIHCFRTPKRKKYWKKGFRWHMAVSTNATMFIFFGERSIVEFIKNEIELVSIKVSQDALSFDFA